jgi:hypothetical protein
VRRNVDRAVEPRLSSRFRPSNRHADLSMEARGDDATLYAQMRAQQEWRSTQLIVLFLATTCQRSPSSQGLSGCRSIYSCILASFLLSLSSMVEWHCRCRCTPSMTNQELLFECRIGAGNEQASRGLPRCWRDMTPSRGSLLGFTQGARVDLASCPALCDCRCHADKGGRWLESRCLALAERGVRQDQATVL